MIINKILNTHLTYCLNIHPGESWGENFAAIKNYSLNVKNRVCPEKPFGLGLRLSKKAACELYHKTELDKFRAFLKENELYVFTLNGFPYGQFHGEIIKEKVYEPDWRTSERKNYTIMLGDILAGLLDENMEGSISTLPGSYKSWIKNHVDVIEMVKNLMDCVYHLGQLKSQTGKSINLALEPEPDCYLETTNEIIGFFEKEVFSHGLEYLTTMYGLSVKEGESRIHEHLGVCFDTCHLSLQFENLSESLKKLKDHGIIVSKIQLSSALKAEMRVDLKKSLEPFIDPVYLHQTRIKTNAGNVIRFNDLPSFIKEMPENFKGEFRSHFHVPLYFQEHNGLMSTIEDLDLEFWNLIGRSNNTQLEIETYTFDALPEELKSIGVVESLSKELLLISNTLRK